MKHRPRSKMKRNKTHRSCVVEPSSGCRYGRNRHRYQDFAPCLPKENSSVSLVNEPSIPCMLWRRSRHWVSRAELIHSIELHFLSDGAKAITSLHLSVITQRHRNLICW